MPDPTMQSPLKLVQKLASDSTRLSLQLYNFSSTTSLSTRDISDLASKVTQISGLLRQITGWIKGNDGIPSGRAYRDICEIVKQCNAVFVEVDSIAPVSRLSSPVNSTGPLRRESWNWTSLPRAKLMYLSAYLDALSNTLAVMNQAFYAGQVIFWSRRDDFGDTSEIIETEQMEIKGLVIKQQLSLIRVPQLWREYQNSRNPSPQQETSVSPRLSGRLVSPSNDQGPDPRSLIYYQEESLVLAQHATSESEVLGRVQSVAAGYVDSLLYRWTRLGEMRDLEKQLSRAAFEDPEMAELEKRSSVSSQQATVETDNESDVEEPKRRTNDDDHQGPVLDYAENPSRQSKTAPIDIARKRNPRERRPGLVATASSPATPSSSSGARMQFTPPSSPNSSVRRSSMRPGLFNTRTSPTTAAMAAAAATNLSPSTPGLGLNMSGMPSGPGSTTSTQSSSAEIREKIDNSLGIGHRMRLYTSMWDFVDGQLDHSNTQLPPAVGMADSRTVTEIRDYWVLPEALEERNINYTMLRRNDSGEGDRKTKLRRFYAIEMPLTFADIKRLIHRSVEIDIAKRERKAARRRRESTEYSTSPPSSSQRRGSLSRTRAENDVQRQQRRNSVIYEPTLEDMSQENNIDRGRRSSQSRRRYSEGRRPSGERRGSNIMGALTQSGGVARLLTDLAGSII